MAEACRRACSCLGTRRRVLAAVPDARGASHRRAAAVRGMDPRPDGSAALIARGGAARNSRGGPRAPGGERRQRTPTGSPADERQRRCRFREGQARGRSGRTIANESIAARAGSASSGGPSHDCAAPRSPAPATATFAGRPDSRPARRHDCRRCRGAGSASPSAGRGSRRSCRPAARGCNAGRGTRPCRLAGPSGRASASDGSNSRFPVGQHQGGSHRTVGGGRHGPDGAARPALATVREPSRHRRHAAS
jgi:hypothetical protein